jgi:hypothetical protein
LLVDLLTRDWSTATILDNQSSNSIIDADCLFDVVRRQAARCTILLDISSLGDITVVSVVHLGATVSGDLIGWITATWSNVFDDTRRSAAVGLRR